MYPAVSMQVSLNLAVGETFRFEPDVDPDEAFVTLVWASSDETIAVVDQSGSVTAISSGTASITATAHYGCEAIAVCIVTVTENPVAAIGLDQFGSLAAAFAATQSGDEIILLQDCDESVAAGVNLTFIVPYGIRFNGEVLAENGYAVVSADDTDGNKIFTVAMARFDSWSVTVGSDLTMNYYVTLDEAFADAKMLFTRHKNSSSSTTKTVDGAVSDPENGTYRFSYTGISPHFMADFVDAQLTVAWGGEDAELSLKSGTSIRGYCDALYNEQSGNSPLVDLLSDMLAYGAAAQQYKDYNTGDLANSLDWDEPTTFVPPNQTDFLPGQSNETGRFTRAGMLLGNVNYLNFGLTVGDPAGKSVKLYRVIDENQVLVREDDVSNLTYDETVGAYYFRSPPILATGYDEVYRMELLDSQGPLHWATYSVRSYVLSKCDDDTVSLRLLVRTMYNYGKSAKAYADQ